MRFTKEFKQDAIKLKKQGMHPNKIFTRHGIDISGKQKDYAGKMISRWISNIEQEKKLDSEEVQVLKKMKMREENKRIEYLEARVAYLEAEKSFLAKLPKKK